MPLLYNRELGSPSVWGNLAWSSTQGVIQFRVRLGFSFLKLLVNVILVVYDLISDLQVTCVFMKE